MTCSGRYATATEYDSILCAGLDLTDPDTVAAIESALDLAAADIQANMASAGMCNCSISAWGLVYLKKLNVLDAAIFKQCPCGNSFSDEEKRLYITWITDQYKLIRDGELDLCEGATGSSYPAVAIAQINYGPMSEAKIRLNSFMRYR